MDIPGRRITFGVTDYSDDNDGYDTERSPPLMLRTPSCVGRLRGQVVCACVLALLPSNFVYRVLFKLKSCYESCLLTSSLENEQKFR